MNRIEAIRDELAANPATYAGLTHLEIMDVMNLTERVGKRETLPASVIFDSFDAAEWAVVKAIPAQLADIDRILSLENPIIVKAVSPAMKALTDIFTASSITISNITKARRITSSTSRDLGLGKVTEPEIKFAKTGAY